ncbi:MAG: SPOR domain-containing protein [Nitrospirae bacterium]|nr:SPOR domain-containing protein [Nitrospirota bacterium]
MNDAEFSERPSGAMLGKEFIIVLVIIFSGLSFTLGYFVGKSGTAGPEPALQAVETSGQVQKQEMPPLSPSPAAAPAPEQTQAVLPLTKEPVLQAAPITEKPAVRQAAHETKAKPAEVKEKGQPKGQATPQQKNAESQNTKSAPEKSAQKVEPSASAEAIAPIYTVQIGAFKNIAEAKQLKAKFDKKGYKSFISTGKNKKAQKIFKVKTGEFREKKEAEVLALKLKKTEALQTYVTMKTE